MVDPTRSLQGKKTFGEDRPAMQTLQENMSVNGFLCVDITPGLCERRVLQKMCLFSLQYTSSFL